MRVRHDYFHGYYAAWHGFPLKKAFLRIIFEQSAFPIFIISFNPVHIVLFFSITFRLVFYAEIFVEQTNCQICCMHTKSCLFFAFFSYVHAKTNKICLYPCECTRMCARLNEYEYDCVLWRIIRKKFIGCPKENQFCLLLLLLLLLHRMVHII